MQCMVIMQGNDNKIASAELFTLPFLFKSHVKKNKKKHGINLCFHILSPKT